MKNVSNPLLVGTSSLNHMAPDLEGPEGVKRDRTAQDSGADRVPGRCRNPAGEGGVRGICGVVFVYLDVYPVCPRG